MIDYLNEISIIKLKFNSESNVCKKVCPLILQITVYHRLARRYIVRFTATSTPAQWSFSKEIDVSVHPRNYERNDIGRLDLKVRLAE